MIAVPIKAILALGSFGVLAQILPAPVPTQLDSITRLTFDGAMVIAVGVLWRALAAKDLQLMAMTSKVTETMVLVLEGVKEARKASEDIGAALDDLSSNIGALPCAMDGTMADKAEKKDALRRYGRQEISK